MFASVLPDMLVKKDNGSATVGNQRS